MKRQAMIFAAGMGTRLKPITDRMPKALVPVASKPLLQHIIEKLHNNGITEIVANVHHFADMIEQFIADNNYDIKTSDERECLLETGGGLKHARSLFKEKTPILIHNVDILSNVDIDALYEKGCLHDAVLLVSERKTSRYLMFDDDMRLVGWTNIQTGEVRGRKGSKLLAFSGIHTFSPTLFPLMDEWPEKFSIIDFYLKQCENYDIRGYVQPDLKLMDVGKLDTLDAAVDFLATIENK